MRLFVITVCHMQPQIIAYSLTQAVMTMGLTLDDISNWTMVDHHWPLEKEKTSDILMYLSDIVDAYIISPEKNLGAHGGFNFAVERLVQNQKLSDYDLVLSYDPDSNPVNPGWLKAMTEVMQADPNLDYLSLMPSVCVGKRNWMIQTIAGHGVARDNNPEMINVTLWRGKCIKQKMTANSSYYGHVESSMWSRGFKSAYLYDYREDPSPIPHPQIYTQWKIDHASKVYAGNFDQYLKDKNYGTA